MGNVVDNPEHYKGNGMEAIDVMEAFLGGNEYEGFLCGNVIKYVLRHKKKGGVEDLLKARWYLDRLVHAEAEGEGNE